MAWKRRVNLALAARSASSGSIFSLRARLATTNSRSPTPRAGAVAGVAGLDELGHLLGQLVEHRAGVGPVEADAGGAVLQLHRAGQGGQARGDAVERALRRRAARSAALIASQSAVCSSAVLSRLSAAEHVRVAADHLVGDAAHHVVEGEGAGLLGHRAW